MTSYSVVRAEDKGLMLSPPSPGRFEESEIWKETFDEETSRRPWSRLVMLRYLLSMCGIAAGIVVIFLWPRDCPPHYSEDNTEICEISFGDRYECRDGNSCTRKVITGPALAAGLVTIAAFLIIACVGCLHQARCILRSTTYDDKICFCI